MNHRILVACGSGIATSTHVATVIRERLAQRGVQVTTTQCRIQDLNAYLAGIDLVVTTSPVSTELDVPIINGVSFLTGIGADATLQAIQDALKQQEA